MVSEGDSARTQGNTVLITYYEDIFETLKNFPMKKNIFCLEFSERVNTLMMGSGHWIVSHYKREYFTKIIFELCSRGFFSCKSWLILVTTANIAMH